MNEENQYDLDMLFSREAIDAAEQSIYSFSQAKVKKINNLEQSIIAELKEALKYKTVKNEAAEKVFKSQRSWLKQLWPKYSKEQHIEFASNFDDPNQPYFEYYARNTGNDDAGIVIKEIISYWASK